MFKGLDKGVVMYASHSGAHSALPRHTAGPVARVTLGELFGAWIHQVLVFVRGSAAPVSGVFA